MVKFSDISALKRQPVAGHRPSGFPQPVQRQMEQPAVPYVSNQQRKFFHSPGAKAKGISAPTVKEFDQASKRLQLPDKAKPHRHKVKFPRPDSKP